MKTELLIPTAHLVAARLLDERRDLQHSFVAVYRELEQALIQIEAEDLALNGRPFDHRVVE